MANTSLGTPSDTRIIIQFRSITQKIDIMIKLKLSILVWAIGLSMTAFSQTISSLRAKVLTLNDYPDALRLWELYNDSASVMDKATQLHAKVSLYYYFNRPDEMLQCVDSLLTLYPKECTTEQKLAYCYVKAEKLLEKGHYKKLNTWWKSLRKDKKLYREIEKQENFPCSEKAIQGLSDKDDFRMDFPESSSTVPTSYTYPLVLSVTINGTTLPATIFDTGAPYTFLTKETATKCNVQCMGDTIPVKSMFGTSQATTGFVKTLQLGSITFHNVTVHVSLLEKDPIFSGHDALLGLKELRGISALEFEFGKLTLKQKSLRSPLDPNMCFAETGCAFLFANGQNYLLDTGGEGSFSNTPDSVSTKVIDVNGYPVQFFNTYTTIPAAQKSGLLGFPFFSGFKICTLDFDRMNFSGEGYRLRKSYSELMNSGDMIGLDIEYERISKTTDEMGKWLTNASLEMMKNKPESCIQYTDSLLGKYQQELGGSIIYVLNLRAASLAYLGLYKEAGDLMKMCAQAVPDMINGYNKCMALTPFGAQQLSWEQPEVTLNTTFSEKGFLASAEINGNKNKLYFAPDQINSSISEADAGKLNMKIIEFEDHTTATGKKRMAIANELKLGNLLIKNVQFNLTEGNDIILGNSLLRLIPQFSIESQKLVLMQQVQSFTNAKQYPLLLINYTFCFRHPDYDTQKISIGNPTPYTRKITLQDLCKSSGKIVFDMKDMKLLKIN